MFTSFFIILGIFLVGHQCQGVEQDEKTFQLDDKAKKQILLDKNVDVFLRKNVDYWMKNPIVERELQCYEKMSPDQSIDFVIDLAPSPSMDDVDKRCANSPIGLYLETYRPRNRSPSKSYFDSVQDFIEAVTCGLKPEMTYSIIYDNVSNKRFYLRGRANEAVKLYPMGDFSDMSRNLRAMWPAPTGSQPDDAKLSPIISNNLGRLTKLTLWNRNNGLPTVLGDSKDSKSVYTIIISDGSSGAKLSDLTKDIGRTTVIDVGERRFASKMTWDETKSLASLFTLNAPQQLSTVVNTVRNMACWLITK